ncbi:MAG: hypothetical protein IT430_04000 [Phycisphaerales bacterium]|nr:hypothetical protein [Phycisphaerales bacterium]
MSTPATETLRSESVVHVICERCGIGYYADALSRSLFPMDGPEICGLCMTADWPRFDHVWCRCKSGGTS